MAASPNSSHEEIAVDDDDEDNHDEMDQFFSEREDDVKGTRAVMRTNNGGGHGADAGRGTQNVQQNPTMHVVPPPPQVSSPPRPPERIALDGGWGWWVVVACAYMHFLFGGFERSFGVVYVQLIDRFGTSATLTAAIGGGFTALRFGLAPVVCSINKRYSTRRVTAVGALIFSTGCFCCAFATTPAILFVTYSLLCGVGSSLVYFPAIILIGEYFDRRKGIAMGLATAGAGLGTFITPPIYQLAFDTYGFAGAFWLMGAFLLNLFACSLLYRPATYKTLPPSAALGTVNPPSPPGGQANGEDKGRKEEPNEKQPLLAEGQRQLYNRSCSPNIPAGTRIPLTHRKLILTPSFSCYVLTQGLGTLSYISAQALIVAHAMKADDHLPADKAVYILSIIGISDTVGRVLSGFFYDVPRIRRVRPYAYVSVMLALSSTLLAWAFCSSFAQFSGVAVANGLFTGAMVTGRPILVADVVGNENMPNAFGLTNLGQGIGVLAGPYVAGVIRDATGSYGFSYVFLGACCFVGAISFLLGYRCKLRVEPTRDN